MADPEGDVDVPAHLPALPSNWVMKEAPADPGQSDPEVHKQTAGVTVKSEVITVVDPTQLVENVVHEDLPKKDPDKGESEDSKITKSRDDVPDVLSSRLDCKQGAVRAVRFSADGCFCMTCGSNKSLKLWNPYRGVLLRTYVGHGYEVLDCQGACDNSSIVSCGMDRAVMVWEVTSGRVLNRWRGHAGTVNCVRFNEDSTVAVSGGVDGAVKAWDCRSRRMDPIQSLDEAKDSVTSLQVTDHEIVSGSADGRIRRYDLRNGRLTTDTMSEAVGCVTISRDGQCTLVGCMDATLKLIDCETGELLNEFTGHKNAKYPLGSCLNASDAVVLSGSEDGQVYCWDLMTAAIVSKLSHPASVVHSLSFHPRRPVLLTAAAGDIYLWQNQSEVTDQ